MFQGTGKLARVNFLKKGNFSKPGKVNKITFQGTEKLEKVKNVEKGNVSKPYKTLKKLLFRVQKSWKKLKMLRKNKHGSF